MNMIITLSVGNSIKTIWVISNFKKFQSYEKAILGLSPRIRVIQAYITCFEILADGVFEMSAY